MASANIHVHSGEEEDQLKITCETSEPVIWIRSEDYRISVSLDLIKADRSALRAALDAADAIATAQTLTEK